MGKRPPLAESPMLRSGIALAGANRNPLPGIASSSALGEKTAATTATSPPWRWPSSTGRALSWW
jgi:hypothetical protein